MLEKMVNVYRGELVESIHYGHIAIVDKDGKDLAYAGDKDIITYWRSAAKPFQSMAVITTGASSQYDITDSELAVMSASHNGEEEHTTVVRGILKKLRLEEDALQCGIHPPYYKPAARNLYKQGIEPGPIHNNCSGKHAGLLAICQKMGWSLDDYNNPDHPVQQLLLSIIAEVTDYPRDKIFTGVDGCGVVVFGLPLRNMAYAYARLANPDTLPLKYREAAQRVTRSMENNPHLVGGTDRFDTDLLEITGNKLIAKSGAEGIFCTGVHGKMGLALKVADGNSRAVAPVIVEALFQLGLLSEEEKHKLKKYHYPEVINNHQAPVGRMEPVFQLNYL
jgi:L-asparaginase II